MPAAHKFPTIIVGKNNGETLIPTKIVGKNQVTDLYQQ